MLALICFLVLSKNENGFWAFLAIRKLWWDIHWDHNCLRKLLTLTACLNWLQMILWVILLVRRRVPLNLICPVSNIPLTRLNITIGWRRYVDWRMVKQVVVEVSHRCHWIYLTFSVHLYLCLQMLAGRQVSLEFRGHDRKLGVIYFPTNWGAKEPQNLPNHRVAKTFKKHDISQDCLIVSLY